DDPGILRIDFPGFSGKQTLEQISWEQFFDAFEDNQLAFLYEDAKNSRFSKLVSRDAVELTDEGNGKRKRRKGKRAKAGAKRRGVDALELLEQQHRECDTLFERIQRAKSASQ